MKTQGEVGRHEMWNTTKSELQMIELQCKDGHKARVHGQGYRTSSKIIKKGKSGDEVRKEV